ncbi:unnamed protein product, partial [Symbiodinium sp. CCMP2456]
SYKKRGGKVRPVNVNAIIDSDDRSTELGFAKHVARIKAQMILDMLHNDEPGDRHVHIRIPGTSRVKDIVHYDSDDEIMEWNLNAADSGKSLKNDAEICMVQPTWIRSKMIFLMVTGCGHDMTKRQVQSRRCSTIDHQPLHLHLMRQRLWPKQCRVKRNEKGKVASSKHLTLNPSLTKFLLKKFPRHKQEDLLIHLNVYEKMTMSE